MLEELDSRAGQLALTSESEACLRGEVEVLRAECARLRAELQEAKRQAEKAGEQVREWERR